MLAAAGPADGPVVLDAAGLAAHLKRVGRWGPPGLAPCGQPRLDSSRSLPEGEPVGPGGSARRRGLRPGATRDEEPARLPPDCGAQLPPWFGARSPRDRGPAWRLRGPGGGRAEEAGRRR